MLKNNLKFFLKRKIIYQISDKNLFIKNNNFNKKYFFVGFDLNSNSLHIGHLSILLFCKRLTLLGYIPIVLLGGSTTYVGDINRKVLFNTNKKNNILKNTKKITSQINYLFKKKLNINNFILLNNNYWLKSINYINFLNKYSYYFSIKKLFNKEVIKLNINNNLSYKDLSYILLQSYDFYYLNKYYNVILQIGGSDQWGNIISGINFIKKISNKKVYGITIPLITNNSGIKYSKSNELINNIWLNPLKTTYYEFYQFWISIIDTKVYQYLKIFTFLNLLFLKKIKKLIKIYTISHFKGRLQKLLANEITNIVYGKKILNKIKTVNKLLFTKNKIINKKDFCLFNKIGINNIKLNKINIYLKELLIIGNICKSKKKSIELINSKSIFINNKMINNSNYLLLYTDILYNKYTLIKIGKKKYLLIIWK